MTFLPHVFREFRLFPVVFMRLTPYGLRVSSPLSFLARCRENIDDLRVHAMVLFRVLLSINIAVISHIMFRVFISHFHVALISGLYFVVLHVGLFTLADDDVLMFFGRISGSHCMFIVFESTVHLFLILLYRQWNHFFFSLLGAHP